MASRKQRINAEIELARVCLRASARNFYEALDTKDEEDQAVRMEVAAIQFVAVLRDSKVKEGK